MTLPRVLLQITLRNGIIGDECKYKFYTMMLQIVLEIILFDKLEYF